MSESKLAPPKERSLGDKTDSFGYNPAGASWAGCNTSFFSLGQDRVFKYA